MSYFTPSADQPADGLARLERAGGVYVAEPASSPWAPTEFTRIVALGGLI
jgi:hypothetical protein